MAEPSQWRRQREVNQEHQHQEDISATTDIEAGVDQEEGEADIIAMRGDLHIQHQEVRVQQADLHQHLKIITIITTVEDTQIIHRTTMLHVMILTGFHLTMQDHDHRDTITHLRLVGLVDTTRAHQTVIIEDLDHHHHHEQCNTIVAVTVEVHPDIIEEAQLIHLRFLDQAQKK